MLWNTLEAVLIINVLVVAVLIIGKDVEYWKDEKDDE